MQEYDTYIFDLDGTLLDTLDDLTASTNYALSKYGMKMLSREDVKMFVGNGVKKLIERATPDGIQNPLFDRVFTEFQHHYMNHSMDKTKPYPGVMEMLAELKSRGKRLAVVSNKMCAVTQKLCQFFFGNLIEVAIGESENIRKKPSPDTVIEALRLLGVSADRAVYIGDSDVDVMTAMNSGLPCINVLWGFRDRAFLLGHGASIFVEHPMQLLNYTVS